MCFPCRAIQNSSTWRDGRSTKTSTSHRSWGLDELAFFVCLFAETLVVIFLVAIRVCVCGHWLSIELIGVLPCGNGNLNITCRFLTLGVESSSTGPRAIDFFELASAGGMTWQSFRSFRQSCSESHTINKCLVLHRPTRKQVRGPGNAFFIEGKYNVSFFPPVEGRLKRWHYHDQAWNQDESRSRSRANQRSSTPVSFFSFTILVIVSEVVQGLAVIQPRFLTPIYWSDVACDPRVITCHLPTFRKCSGCHVEVFEYTYMHVHTIPIPWQFQ